MITLVTGDALEELRRLPEASADCCVTSPPYWGLRNYGVGGQLGLEASPYEYVEKLTTVFRELRRVLRDDGTLWLNLGDCYATGAGGARSPGGQKFGKSNAVIDAGSYPANQPNRGRIEGLKPKELVGLPWRVAFALQADGWYLRSDIVWHKPNPMPESVGDRPTRAHEYIFLLAKSRQYYYDADAVREPLAEDTIARSTRGRSEKHKYSEGAFSPQRKQTLHRDVRQCFHPKGRNRRSVWRVSTQPFKGAHFATFPPKLIEPCILAGSRAGGLVVDPFSGAATTGLVARQHGRRYLGIELNPEYTEIARRRLHEHATSDN